MAERTWDVIVVGAGLGGMLAGATLARHGRRVLVLEREKQAGGRLRSFEADGFVIDAGAYLWPNAHLDEALAAAGAEGFAASTIPLARVLRIYAHGDGGRALPFPWPGAPDSAALRHAAKVALEADAEVYERLDSLWNELAALPDEEMRAFAHMPVGDALPRFTRDPGVRRAFLRNLMLFGTYDPESASMAECIRLRRRGGGGPAARPQCPGANAVGGMRALPLALQGALVASGAELRLGWTVDQIHIDGGRVHGVFAHGEKPFRERLDAAVVVSNVPVWQFFTIAPESAFPSDLVASARRYAVVGGTAGAAFAFDGLPRLRETREADDFPGWTRLLTGSERGFGGGMLWSSLHSPRNAPAGKHLLQAMRLSPHSDLADAHRVERILADFRAMLDEIYLDVEAKLRWMRTWTTRDGSEYMISAAPRPAVRAPGVTGLYLVGETTDVPAVQMDAAALSALRAVEMITSDGAP
jgi:phytoene dehydrogenase-like protein